jgi:putative colanic acid biosynthesis acetyltransferase WcaF
MTVHLASFKKNAEIAKKGLALQAVWLFAGLPLLRASWLPGESWRVGLLRLFGARIGHGVRIKTGVRVKYPWRLTVGNDCWIGEDCWMDNMADVVLGNDVCLSQGCYLCTGNHDWKDRSFRMFAQGIMLENGCWIASRAVLGPGVVIGESAVVAIGSVVSKSIPAGEIHGGNPAVFLGLRKFASGDGVGEHHVKDARATSFAS